MLEMMSKSICNFDWLYRECFSSYSGSHLNPLSPVAGSKEVHFQLAVFVSSRNADEKRKKTAASFNRVNKKGCLNCLSNIILSFCCKVVEI